MIQDIPMLLQVQIYHTMATLSAPSVTGNSNTLNGVTSTWTNLDIDNKPNFTITTAGSVSIHRKLF